MATLGAPPRTTAFVEDFCKLRDLGRTDALRLTLIVEELLTNPVTPGHLGNVMRKLGYSVRRQGGTSVAL